MDTKSFWIKSLFQLAFSSSFFTPEAGIVWSTWLKLAEIFALEVHEVQKGNTEEKCQELRKSFLWTK